nr:copia protein [Tanacetum cinerariifolium]
MIEGELVKIRLLKAAPVWRVGELPELHSYPQVARARMSSVEPNPTWPRRNLEGDSPNPTRVIEGVIQPVAPAAAEQRLARKNELKDRGNLLMALPDKHQLKYNIHKDAKTLMEVIEKRFGRNKETKKVKKTLLKQQSEKFTCSCSESLDQIHDRLQKLISEILEESLSQEDINLKFLRSLPIEWRTHTLIWRNKTDLEDQSLDDLFNSLKICKIEVKSSSSGSTSTQNIAFVSSQNTDSTNEPVSAVASVSAASAKIPVFTLPNMDTLSNAMAMLTVRARQFLQRTRRNLRANGPTSMGFDMSKVECYNCHRKGHFSRECRSPKDTRRNVQVEPQRRNVPVETSTSNALVLQCDDVGSYDWSYQAEEDPTDYALMAFTSSSSSSSNNELRDNALVVLRQKIKKAKQERDELKLKLEKFQTYSKNLSQLLASQTNDKTELAYDTQVFTSSIFDCDEMFSSESDISMPASLKFDWYQSGEGYNAVPPPYTRTFMPPKPDLVFHNAPNINETVHTAFHVDLSPTKPDKDLSHTHRPSAPIIEDWVSDLEDDYEAELPQNAPTANLKTAISKPKTHGNSRNRKACFVCKSFNHLIKDCGYYEKKMAQTPARNHAQRGNHQHYARMTHPNPQRHVVPTTVITKSKLVPLSIARPVTTTVLQHLVTIPRPAKTVVTKPHSPPRRTINRRPSPAASNFPPQVTTVKAPKVNAIKGVQGNWINGGYVAFGGNPKGGKISGKGKIRTGKLNFDDVYFVKELKFNLFSVLQKYDKKNSVTDTECIVLSPEFKLPDKNQVLLRVHRENNMYNVDLKNIVPSDLTCLFAKATLDESNLWHKRLGHINFKIINKLVKGSGPTGLFDIDTLTKSMNYQPVTAGNQFNSSAGVQEQFDAEKAGEENVQQYVLFPLWSPGSKDPQNTDGDATFEVKKPEFEGRKPESEVYVFPSSSAKTKKHDDKTKREAKGKSHVELSIGYRNLTLEDITYLDDEEDVSAEADFSNLETTITAIGTKWDFRNKKDERGIVVRNKARLVAQGHTQEEGIDYEEVFALVARIEATRLFLAYASFMGFMVYQMDVKSAFLYRTIEEEVYVCQPSGFEDPDYPDKVYEVVKALYGLHQAPRACQDKYVAEILKKFGLTDRKSASTPIDTEKPLLKDPDGDDMDVHTYRSMIALLMYLSSSRPDIIAQVGDLSFHTTKYSSPILTQKVFANMKRVGKGLSMVETPLFEGMIVAQQADDVADEVAVGVDVDDVPAVDVKPTPPSPPPTTTPPPQELPSTSQVLPTPTLSPIAQPSSPLQQQQPSQTTIISMDLLNNLLETCTALTRRVENLEQDKIAQALEITKLKQRIRKLEKKKNLRVSGLKRLRKVETTQRIESFVDTIMNDQKDASKHGGIIAKIDADEDVIMEEVDAENDAKVVEKDANVQGRPEESQAQIYKIDLNHANNVLMVTAATTTITAVAPITSAIITAALSAARKRKGVVIIDLEEIASPSIIIHTKPKSKDKGKGIMVEEPKPLKKQAQIEQDVKVKGKQDNNVLRYQALKWKPQTEAQAKKNMMVYLKNMAGFKMDYFKGMSYNDIRPIFEKYFNSNVAFLKKKLDEEVEELKKHLHIVPNDDDDDVYTEDTPIALKLFLSLLRNFDREDLEMLWQIVQERFASSKPKNFSCDFLLTTLTYMFEKPDVKAQVWKNQRRFHDDLPGREKISINKVHFGSDDEQCKTSKIYSKGLRLLVKDLLLVQIDAADIKLRLLEQSAAVDEKMKKYD